MEKASVEEAATVPREADIAEHGSSGLKLDRHGLPLVPQPTEHEDDPLNWPTTLKVSVLLQVSFLAFLGPMAAAAINPALVPLGRAFGITPVEASYELTVFIIFAGFGPLFLVPYSNVYGRRPLYLAGWLLASVTNLIAGHSPNWVGIMLTRAFNGIGVGITTTLGAATVCDLFFLHERGFYMGIYAYFLGNGAHFASLIGGFIAQRLGWRECFNIPSYIQFGLLAINIFCLPETLYVRHQEIPLATSSYSHNSFLDLLLLQPKHLPDKEVRLADFWKPFRMMRYPRVIIPAVYYMTCFTYGSLIFAVTGSEVFGKRYGFNTEQTGLMLSIPLLLGCLIGEANAGWFTDWLVYRNSKRVDGKRLPAPRLDALWLALLIPVGTIIQGVCISHASTTSWVGNAFGMAIANFGFQVSTTVVYSFCTDCYKPQSAEISTVLNLFRMVFSALVSFYAIPLADAIQYQYAWLVFASINIVLWVPTFGLRFYGRGSQDAG